jgi:hypothetical protein
MGADGSSENSRAVMVGGCVIPLIIVLVIVLGIIIWYAFYHDNDEVDDSLEHHPNTFISVPATNEQIS